MATAFVTDFYKRSRPEATDDVVLRLAQRLTVLFGGMGTGVALVIATARLESTWDLFLQVIALTGGAPQLLNCLEHASDNGPPFSVLPDEVARLYGPHYRITLLTEERTLVFGTSTAARQSLWHLTPL